MRTSQDAKVMAKSLRTELSRRDITLSHGQCLDIVARLFGFNDWNVLAAWLDAETPARASAPGKIALPLPTGWTFEGARLDYDAGVDRQMRCGAGHPAVIRSRFATDLKHTQSHSGLGALVQELDASAYRGKRLRLQAKLKTEAVIGAATIWLQVDRSRARDVLVLDNMEERAKDGALAGTQDWTTRRIVLDVPPEAGVIHYGFYLRGSGTVWASGFDLREAEPGEMMTKAPERLLPGPINLDFSKFDRLAS
jgi:hypothetical protein